MEINILNITVNAGTESAGIIVMEDLLINTITVLICFAAGAMIYKGLRCLYEIYQRETKKCSSCRRNFERSEVGKYKGKYYCMTCYKRKFNVCHGCKKVVKEKLINFHGHKICNRCNSKGLTKCQTCNKMYGKWEMHKIGLFKHCCKKCYDKYHRRFRKIAFKQTKINPTTFKKNPFKRYCGVEIECRNNDRNRNCFIKDELKKLKYSQWTDGSLNLGGVEFVSRPMNGDNLFDKISHFCNILNKKKYFVDKSCGLHIHLETPKKVNYLKKIYLFYKKFEPLIFNMVPKSRQRTSYCHKYERYYKNSIQELFNVKTLNDFKSMVYETKSKEEVKGITSGHCYKKRYCWINLHSIFYQGTLEIRNHSGTTSAEKINNWLLLHLTILDYLKKVDLNTVNELDVNKKTFLSIFPNKELKNYVKERWDKFEKGYEEEKY